MAVFSIYDGRESFWQWDLNQRLVVSTDVCSEVHFCNGTTDCALVCNVYEQDGKRLVNVPNVLLQTGKPLRVFSYDKDHTIHSALFTVIARTKPDDYVYTETEIQDIKTVVKNALNEAKESGLFDGDPGKDGLCAPGTGYNSALVNRSGEAIGEYSTAAGRENIASGEIAYAQGYLTKSTGNQSHTEGNSTTASGDYAHAEGVGSIASGKAAHADGRQTIASGAFSHAEGNMAEASGEAAHAEGTGTKAIGIRAHAEGYNSEAHGDNSHAEGRKTKTIGANAHAEGNETIAASDNQHVQGKFNIEDTAGKYAHIVGNGTADNKRSNAHTIDWQGNAWYAGNVKVGADGKELATKEDVKNAVDNVTAGNVDLSGYYTKPETDTAIDNAVKKIPQTDLTNYYTKAETETEIAEALANILTGGGGAEWRLIGDITLAEEAMLVELSEDMDGKPLNCHEICIFIKNVGTDSNDQATGSGDLFINGIRLCETKDTANRAGTTSMSLCGFNIGAGFFYCSDRATYSTTTAIHTRPYLQPYVGNVINKVGISPYSPWHRKYGIGSTFKIYGR